MASAVHRVFDLPELLEQILLNLPIPNQEDGFPDLQFQELKYVNRSFKYAICRPGKLNRRMLEGDAAKSDSWSVPDYLCEHNVLPPTEGRVECLRPRQADAMQSESHMMYECASQLVSLNLPGGEWGCVDAPGGAPEILEDAWEGPIYERVAYPEASWRKIPLHPTKTVETTLPIALWDTERRLENGEDDAEMVYHFYSGGDFERMTLGQLYEVLEQIRQFDWKQHLWMYNQALALRDRRCSAHRAALEKVGEHTHDGPTPERWITGRRCDDCERVWHDLPRPACPRCLVAGCTYENLISISWPMDRDLFSQVKEIEGGGTKSEGVGPFQGHLIGIITE